MLQTTRKRNSSNNNSFTMDRFHRFHTSDSHLLTGGGALSSMNIKPTGCSSSTRRTEKDSSVMVDSAAAAAASILRLSPPESPVPQRRPIRREEERMGASGSSGIRTRTGRSSSGDLGMSASCGDHLGGSVGSGGGVRRAVSSTRSHPTRAVRRNLTGDFDGMSNSSTTNTNTTLNNNSMNKISMLQRSHSHNSSGANTNNRASPPPSASSAVPSNHTTPHNTPYGMLNPGGGPSSSKYPWSSSANSRGSPYHYRQNYSNNNNNKRRWIASHRQWIALLGLITLGIMAVAVYQHDSQLHQALVLKTQLVQQHQEHSKELEIRFATLKTEAQQLEDRIEQLQQPSPNKVDLESQRKLFFLEHEKLRVQQDVQNMSKRMLKERFGNGPNYFVEMQLQFDPQSNVYQKDDEPQQQVDNRVVIETASLEYMPHSVYLFLEQVNHGLYDGTAFHRNAAHLLQAGPSANPDKHAAFRREPSLNSVMFQEYAPEMAHKQYTIGYPGRPGGPDFYINMRDNSFLHGPGGQTHHYSDMVTDADPCFAKIVQGFQTIERVHKSAVEPGGFHDAMVSPVTIVKMTVLKDYVQPPDDQ